MMVFNNSMQSAGSRTFALLLLGALLLPSCKESSAAVPQTPETDAVSSEAVTAAVTEAPTEAELRAQIPDNLPDLDMEGYDFRIWHREREDFVSDVGLLNMEQTGDIVDDAIFARNLSVMERFNCRMTERSISDEKLITEMRKAVRAGEDAFDLGLAQVVKFAPSAMAGHYLDWYTDLPYVNLEQPWYIGNAVEAASVEGHAYMMFGEYDFDILRFTYCMYWNKKIAQDFDIENIYDVVKDGRWTYDYLRKLSGEIYSDLNSDGVKGEEDLLCLSTDPYSSVVAFQYAFDNPLFRNSRNGLPEMVFNQEKAHDIVTKLNDLFWVSPGGYTNTWGTGRQAWLAGHLLCYANMFETSEIFRDLEFDFGIIPYPKYDETQEKYLTMSDGAHGCMAVPITISNPEYTSVIIEALNAETYKQVLPAYYDTALKVKYARDNESSQVLDLLMDGRVFDFGYIYDTTGLVFIVQEMVSTNSDNSESRYAKLMSNSVKQFNKVIEKYQELDG